MNASVAESLCGLKIPGCVRAAGLCLGSVLVRKFKKGFCVRGGGRATGGRVMEKILTVEGYKAMIEGIHREVALGPNKPEEDYSEGVEIWYFPDTDEYLW